MCHPHRNVRWPTQEYNLQAEFRKITELVEAYPYVAMVGGELSAFCLSNAPAVAGY